MNFSLRSWMIIGAVVVGISALLVYLAHAVPEALSGQDGQINLTRTLLILAFVGGSLLLTARLQRGDLTVLWKTIEKEFAALF